ncbi:DNA-binding transcriptional regulator, AcrR family [Microlunatus sagamiharensis]|uniref:DNA-binding transcriptional regulator, AcrR family n=1 Tax=Microlunatus sagamiharensis TaxID=546874 RepID=A0A1H2MGU8_9ACTN|nr:TetR/AcrR family transcriptional regulator [Microlunatus sagamiharensis]SDU92409.1 DNA-binding transcriptional regulator, AcrR family [Microlunatus sagamiharensis]
MPVDVPLIERKQREARRRIVAAAEELFAARGFAAVSVSDIAERAEVGRTTFFRHFGDKQEVVFAREQELLDLLAAETLETDGPDDRSASAALRALEPVLLCLCERMTADLDGYRRHVRLVEDHPELGAREGVKMQVVTERLTDLLVAQGWAGGTATFAAEIALACYRTARRTSPDPATLVAATRTAIHHALGLGTR